MAPNGVSENALRFHARLGGTGQYVRRVIAWMIVTSVFFKYSQQTKAEEEKLNNTQVNRNMP